MHKCPNEFKGPHFDNSAPFRNPTGKLIQRFDWIAFKYKLQTEYLQALEFPENTTNAIAIWNSGHCHPNTPGLEKLIRLKH